MITKYSDFLNESILISLNESIIYYSPRLRKLLSTIPNKISVDLLSIEGDNVTPDMTYLDISKEDGCVSYIQMRKAKQLIDDYYDGSSHFDTVTNIDQADEIWNDEIESKGIGVSTKSRNLIRIGRLVNQLFPKKYSDRSIEEFVNQLKSSHVKEGEKLEIVSGPKIAYWYDRKNYKNNASGILGGSCMAGFGNTPTMFDIYTKNPEVCRMLILVEDGQLLGRALVWKVSGSYLPTRIRGRIKRIRAKISSLFKPPSEKCEFEYFMDRVYTTKDSDVYKFMKYAEEQGWATKYYNSYGGIEKIKYKGELKNARLFVKLNSESKYTLYPFMDTFRNYDPSNHDLQNVEGRIFGNYLLNDTTGGYQ